MSDLKQNLVKAGDKLGRARQREAEAFEAVRVAVIAAVGAEEVSEVEAGTLGRVDRMTVRKWLGKR